MGQIVGMEGLNVSQIKKMPGIEGEDELTQCKRQLEQVCKGLSTALKKRKQAEQWTTERLPEQLCALSFLVGAGCAELRQDFQRQYDLQQPATKRRASSLPSIQK